MPAPERDPRPLAEWRRRPLAVDTNESAIEAIPFSLDDLLEDVGDALEPAAAAKGLELLLRQPLDVPVLLVGDPARLRQLLCRLGRHAIEDTPRGEVELSVDEVRSQGDELRLAFELRHSGAGRAGSAAGLSSCREVVQSLGGDVEPQGVPGSGGRIRFTLPFALQPLARPAGTSWPERLRGKRLLVIDDSVRARDVMGDMAAGLGFDVVAACGLEDALQPLAQADAQRTPFDLVLIDSKLLDADVASVDPLQRLRGIGGGSPICVLGAAPGRTRAGAPPEQAMAGALRVIAKPITLARFLQACEAIPGLPAPPAPTAAARDTASRHALQGVRVLLVDDNSFNRDIATTLLERGGVIVATACDGYEALEKLQRDEFDAVLMDCQMPVLDGYATTRALRALPRFASLPVIAMTADAHAGDSGKALDSGMNDQVAKPIDVGALYATLARWVRRDQAPADPAG